MPAGFGILLIRGYRIPVFCRGHVVILLKIPAEIQGILESAHIRDLADIIIGGAQEFLCVVQPDFVDILLGCKAGIA